MKCTVGELSCSKTETVKYYCQIGSIIDCTSCLEYFLAVDISSPPNSIFGVKSSVAVCSINKR